jgi:hypothetical protein
MTGTIIAEDEVRGWAGMKFSEVLGIVFQLAGACRSAIENDPADDGFRFDVDRSSRLEQRCQLDRMHWRRRWCTVTVILGSSD